MARILVLFAHPALEKSRVHARMIRNLETIPGLYFHDLYEAYPDFDIDVRKEQQLLLDHDVIVLQHPFYWYSAPALIKQWLDLVLEHGWAYGTGGNKLPGKWMMNAISAGGRAEAYSREGRNQYTVPELLAPVRQTAKLCGMLYLPPFLVHGTHRLTEIEIAEHGRQYHRVLHLLADNKIKSDDFDAVSYSNEFLPDYPLIQS